VGAWERGSVGAWERGSVGACERVGVWACGRVGVWACGRAPPNRERRTFFLFSEQALAETVIEEGDGHQNCAKDKTR
jgi:hypothetical protein